VQAVEEPAQEQKPEAVVPDCTFNGNPLLKRENVAVGLTDWHLKEIEKCILDVSYFAEHYMKIVHVDKGLIPLNLYAYQKKMLKAMQDHRYSIILSCRQSGKCAAGSTEVTASHPDVNGGRPFRTTVKNLAEMCRKMSQRG